METEFQHRRRVMARSLLCVLACPALFFTCLLDAQEPPKLVPALGWDIETQGGFVTSIAVDLQNNVWAGTGGQGLWRYDSRKKAWGHITAADNPGGDTANGGLGDDYVYALAVDKLGRVWAGHLNHGVSVWNGEKWRNYDILDGPLGSRVFAIATCPTDGDVWIATDCGVTRYSLAKDDWDYYTRASGLPSNQVQAIAFDSKGNIFLGTQCDGIAMATAADNYRKWKTVAGPLQMPDAAAGDGLPSSIINDLLVTQGDKMVLAATPEGLGKSEDGGQTWKYVRGQDWQGNVNGLYPAPDDGYVHPEPASGGADQLFMEDWITTIRQDEKTGNIWVGNRKKGLEVRNTAMDKFITGAEQDEWAYTVRGICFPPKGPPLIAVADVHVGGVLTLDNSTAELEPGDAPPKTAPPLPSPVKAPDAAAFAALTNRLDFFKNQLKAGQGVFLGDDWRTEGDWVGRYGTSFALLCGVGADGVYKSEAGFDAQVGLGPHTRNGDTEPEVFVKNKNSGNLRVPYDPSAGHRIEAELNDLSCRLAFYDADWEGPDLWVDTTVPAGLHCVSLYFTNNDEQAGTGGVDFDNKYRDYDLQLLSWQDDRDAVQKSAPMARARVVDFRGGVYKRFIVAGPARYVFRVGRDRSFGTKIQGVFIDRLSDDAPEARKPLPGFDAVEYKAPALKDKSSVENDALLSAAGGLWDALDKSFDKPGVAGLQLPLRVVAWRAAVAGKAPAALLDAWRWRLGIWTKEDRDAFDKAMADAFKSYSAKNPPQPPKPPDDNDNQN